MVRNRVGCRQEIFHGSDHSLRLFAVKSTAGNSFFAERGGHVRHGVETLGGISCVEIEPVRSGDQQTDE